MCTFSAHPETPLASAIKTWKGRMRARQNYPEDWSAY